MTQAERSGGVNELPHLPNLGIPCDDDLWSALYWARCGDQCLRKKKPQSALADWGKVIGPNCKRRLLE